MFSATQLVVLTWQGGVSVTRGMRDQKQGGICLNWPGQQYLPNFKVYNERYISLTPFFGIEKQFEHIK